MIQANELRIGNWVFNKANERKQIKEVYADCSAYDPIPINEEWIMKAGFDLFEYEPNDEMSDSPDFIYLSYKIKQEGKRFFYTITNTEWGDWQFCIKVEWAEEMLISSVKYVHQFQNLCHSIIQTELEFKQ